MPFPEDVKNRVKRKAGFQCCRCKTIGVDVHHIIPESQGGPNDEDNAAPLCQNCHDQFGDNPKKRKEIRLMRDWWYEQIEKIYSQSVIGPNLLNELYDAMQNFKRGLSDFSEVKKDVKNIIRSFSDKIIDDSTPENLPYLSSTFVNSVAVSSAFKAEKQIQLYCQKCGTFSTGILRATNKCPNCGCGVSSGD